MSSTKYVTKYVVPPERDRGWIAPTPSTNIADPYYRSFMSTGYEPHIVVSLRLGHGEFVYSLGERFGPFIKNGQEIDLWNEDAGRCTPCSE
jgi:alpha-D-xyloside xylohydrolase